LKKVKLHYKFNKETRQWEKLTKPIKHPFMRRIGNVMLGIGKLLWQGGKGLNLNSNKPSLFRNTLKNLAGRP